MTQQEAIYLLAGTVLGMVYSIVIILVAGHLRATRWNRALRRTVRQQERFTDAVRRLSDASR